VHKPATVFELSQQLLISKDLYKNIVNIHGFTQKYC